MSGEVLALLGVASFGLIFGSFLNVVIHRVPRKESVVFPGSHCPRCGASLRWFHNLPLLSWLWLRGRCGSCREPISIRYPAVEATSALALVAVWLVFGPTAGFVIFAPYALAMVALFAIDLEHQLLPDAITLRGVVYGLLVSPLNPRLAGLDVVTSRLGEGPFALGLARLAEAAVGAASGYGILWILAEGYWRWRKVEGMGGGDLKLAAMIGAFTGPMSLVAVLFLSSLVGLAVGLGMMAGRSASLQTAIPFGCFLAPAALVVALFGPDALWHAWESLVLSRLLGDDVVAP